MSIDEDVSLRFRVVDADTSDVLLEQTLPRGDAGLMADLAHLLADESGGLALAMVEEGHHVSLEVCDPDGLVGPADVWVHVMTVEPR